MINQIHILTVDDDRMVRMLVSKFLEGEGLAVSEADSVANARKVLASEKIDLILLDISMPGEDGLVLLREMQGKMSVPVIMVTSNDGDVDRVVGLELGADDYVTKPVKLRELLARIRAVLRRSTAKEPEVGNNKEQFNFGGWRLDARGRSLFDPNDEEITLTKGEFQLLSAFVNNSGRPLTRDQLMDLMHGREWVPTDRTIDVTVRRLRQKMEKDPKNPKMIITVHGVGYSFTPRVS